MARDTAHKTLACAACWIRLRSEWSALGPDEVEDLDSNRDERRYAPRESLFRQGEACCGLHCVEFGYVALRATDALGNDTVFNLIGPGQTTGYRSLFAEEPHSATAQALTEARVCFIPAEVVQRLLAGNAEFARRMLHTMARDPGWRVATELRSPKLSIRERLIHVLLMLEEQFSGRLSDGRRTYYLPLSRRELADMIGARVETVVRAIRKLERDGLATFQGQQVFVPALEELRAATGRQQGLRPAPALAPRAQAPC